jgi:hypothetical protein
MRNVIAVSAAALAMAAGSAVPAAAAAPSAVRGPDGVSIEILPTNDLGCPATVSLAPDREAFAVSFGDYTARVGGSSRPDEYRKNCQLNLKVVVPADYSYAISSLEFRMRASLQPGVKGAAMSASYFQGEPGVITTSHDMVGPYEDDFQVTDMVPPEQRRWKPCGQERIFSTNSEVRLDEGTSDSSKVSFVSVGSADSGAVVYHLAWKKC